MSNYTNNLNKIVPSHDYLGTLALVLIPLKSMTCCSVAGTRLNAKNKHFLMIQFIPSINLHVF